jgi:four helix bundle protein
MKTRHFRDLEVWQRSMELAQAVYTASKDFPKSEIFGLAAQMRRAAVSVPSNIAEGHGRLTPKSFAVFLGQARGSLCELETQIELAGKLGYLPAEDVFHLLGEATAVAQMLNGFLRKLREVVSNPAAQRATGDGPRTAP